MAPGEPTMPPSLVGTTATPSATRVPGTVDQFELNSDEDQSDQDHTGDEDEGDDDLGIGQAA
jgi:hypothetical protein